MERQLDHLLRRPSANGFEIVDTRNNEVICQKASTTEADAEMMRQFYEERDKQIRRSLKTENLQEV
jgi:hypothetical protein